MCVEPVVLWAVASLTFLVLRLVPGDPLQAVATLVLDPTQLDRVRADWGLNQPLWQQYFRFMGNLARGDLGLSMASGVPLTRLLFEKMPPTIELAVVAMFISTVIGVGAGILSSTTRNKWVDYGARTFALLGLSIPDFWLGLVGIYTFAVALGWLPSGGFVSMDQSFTGWARSMTLPALTLALTQMGLLARITRSSMLEVLRLDYVRTARAKGLPDLQVVGKHALTNALIPVITVAGVIVGVLLGGAVVIEQVFALPGVGRLIIGAVLRRDYPVIQGGLLLLASIYVFVNIAVDMLYARIDPRVRYD